MEKKGRNVQGKQKGLFHARFLWEVGDRAPGVSGRGRYRKEKWYK